MDLENDIEIASEAASDLFDENSSRERSSGPRSVRWKGRDEGRPPLSTSVLVGDQEREAGVGFKSLMIVPNGGLQDFSNLPESWSAGIDDPSGAIVSSERQVLDVARHLNLRPSVLLPWHPGFPKGRGGKLELLSIRGSMAGSGLLLSLQILLKVLRKRPGCLIVMRPLRHLWLFHLAIRCGLRLILVAETPETFERLSQGLSARIFQGINQATLRRVSGVLTMHSITSDKLRRLGVRPENILQVIPQIVDRHAAVGRDEPSGKALRSLAVVWRGGEVEDCLFLRDRLLDLERSFPQVRIELLIKNNEIDERVSAKLHPLRLRQINSDDLALDRMRAADLVVLWPRAMPEPARDQVALLSLLSGTPILADHAELLPEWTSPAAKRGALLERGGLRKQIARLADNPAHLRRMRRAGRVIAKRASDRQLSLASQLLHLLTR